MVRRRAIPFLIILVTLCSHIEGVSSLFGSGRSNGDKTKSAVTTAGRDGEKTADMNDASTGTITAHSPGADKVPTTCNEMMAKAVVFANEERAQAYTERDNAAEAANRALSEAKHTKEQLETLRLQYKDIENEIAQVKADAKHSISTAMSEAQQEIDTMQASTRNRIMQSEEQANDEIARTNASAKEAIGKARADARDEIDTIQSHAEEEIKLAKERSINATTVAKEIVIQAKKDAETAIREERKFTVDKIAEIDRSTKDAIAKAKQDANDKVSQANNELQRVKSEAAMTMSEIQMDARKTVIQSKEEVESIRLEAKAAVATIKAEEVAKRNKIAAEVVTTVAEKDEELKRSEENLKEAREQVFALTSAQTHLESELEMVSKKLAIWEDHEQPYCNFTRMRSDSENALTQVVTAAERESRHKAKFLYSKSSAAALSAFSFVCAKMSPIVDPHWRKVEEWYREHLKDTVDSKIAPVYKKCVAPVISKASSVSKKAVSLSKKSVNAIYSTVGKGSSSTRSSAARSVRKAAQSVLSIINEKDKNNTVPRCIKQFLQFMENHAEGVVTWDIRILFGLMIYALRGRIKDGAKSVLWLFFPMHVVVGKPKRKEKEHVQSDGKIAAVRPTAKTSRSLPQSTNGKSSTSWAEIAARKPNLKKEENGRKEHSQ